MKIDCFAGDMTQHLEQIGKFSKVNEYKGIWKLNSDYKELKVKFKKKTDSPSL